MTSLTVNEGNFDLAFQELNKMQLRPFLMRIWGQPANDNEVKEGNVPQNEEQSEVQKYQPGDLLKNIDIPTNEEDKGQEVKEEVKEVEEEDPIYYAAGVS